MLQNMTNNRAHEISHGLYLAQNSSSGKKKASWMRTILWMMSMALLGNVFMGIIAYFIFFYHK